MHDKHAPLSPQHRANIREGVRKRIEREAAKVVAEIAATRTPQARAAAKERAAQQAKWKRVCVHCGNESGIGALTFEKYLGKYECRNVKDCDKRAELRNARKAAASVKLACFGPLSPTRFSPDPAVVAEILEFRKRWSRYGV